MKRKLFQFFVIIFLTHSSGNLSISPCIDTAMSLFLEQKYDSARTYLSRELLADPDNLDALYMFLNTYQIELLDYESYILDGDRFVHSADSVLNVIENKTDINNKNGYIRFLIYSGYIYGAKGLVLAKQGDWIHGVKYSRTSVKFLEKSQTIDGTIEAAWYGIGLYNYYIGQNFSWLPFMKSRCQQGLWEIERAARDNSPFSYAAKHSLSWILVDRGDLTRADSLVSSVLSQYPENTIFLRIKARIAFLKQENPKALDLANRLIALSEKRNPVNWSDLLSGYQIVVASLSNMGKKKECLAAADKVLHLEIPVSARKISFVQKHLRYIEEKKENLTGKKN